MDSTVIAAMARWPNVPDVYGWLSLSQQGHWRLHPQGDAISHPDHPGTSISSPQILQFINNNYSHDAAGLWYFQNGPQRVYVRLDAAPFIFHTTGELSSTGVPQLRSHNGLDAGRVQWWLLGSDGMLYANTELGPGLIAGRDLHAILQALHTQAGTSVLNALEDQDQDQDQDNAITLKDDVAFTHIQARDVAQAMGFVRLPTSP